MLATFAKLERERIRERTLAGIETARRKGKKIGRPYAIFDRDRVLQMHKDGLSIRAITDKLNVSKTTVHRTLKAA